MDRRTPRESPEEAATLPPRVSGLALREAGKPLHVDRLLDSGGIPAGETSAAAFLPPRPTMPRLREAAKGCTACHLHRLGTQTVFGEGPPDAALMLVGEQPGDQEDVEGRPFVGPAGRILDSALAEAGVERSSAYVTNAVKHFKWEPRGKRRVHAKPNWTEMTACRPWLESEIAVVAPRALVCLGATAAQTLLGRDSG